LRKWSVRSRVRSFFLVATATWRMTLYCYHFCNVVYSAHAAIATRATQMVEKLSEENRSLRQELKDYYKKVSKLEKVSWLNGEESIMMMNLFFHDLKVFILDFIEGD